MSLAREQMSPALTNVDNNKIKRNKLTLDLKAEMSVNLNFLDVPGLFHSLKIS